MDGAHGDPLMLDHRTDGGLVTLEWLLLVAAVAGLAAASTVAVQRVLDDTAEVPADPHVRVIDADIAAALLVEDANAAALSGTQVWTDFERRCETDLGSAFDDVVATPPGWFPPTTNPARVDPDDPNVIVEEASVDRSARCVVTLRSNLGP